MMSPLNDVFEYLEYREYLRDEFRDRKKQSSIHSLRYISSRTGIDASMLAKLVTAKAHISPERVGNLYDYLGFDESQRDYFGLLLQYGRARIKSESDALIEKILSFRKHQATRLEENQLKYFEHWYHVVIREALATLDSKASAKLVEWVAVSLT